MTRDDRLFYTGQMVWAKDMHCSTFNRGFTGVRVGRRQAVRDGIRKAGRDGTVRTLRISQ